MEGLVPLRQGPILFFQKLDFLLCQRIILLELLHCRLRLGLEVLEALLHHQELVLALLLLIIVLFQSLFELLFQLFLDAVFVLRQVLKPLLGYLVFCGDLNKLIVLVIEFLLIFLKLFLECSNLVLQILHVLL